MEKAGGVEGELCRKKKVLDRKHTGRREKAQRELTVVDRALQGVLLYTDRASTSP